MADTLVFIHGLESTSQGNKGRYFREHFPQMIILDYPGDFAARMRKLNDVLRGRKALVLVGSSYGGLMAACFARENAERVKNLILLAPALTLEEFASAAARPLTIPVVIYHGTKDDIVDPQAVKAIAEKSFSCLEHHLVEDDHPLSNVFPTLPWLELLARRADFCKDPRGPAVQKTDHPERH